MASGVIPMNFSANIPRSWNGDETRPSFGLVLSNPSGKTP